MNNQVIEPQYELVEIILPQKDNPPKKIKLWDEDPSKYNYRQFEYINNLFIPTPQGLRLAPNNYEEFAYWGAFRCGKSFSQQLALFLICVSYPNVRAVYVRDTYDQLKDSVIKQFNEEFENTGTYEYLESSKQGSRIAKFHNGSEIRFRAFNYDTNILSAEYDCAATCQTEDISYELFLQLFGRLSGKNLPKAILLTEGNPSVGEMKTRYVDVLPEELLKKRIFAITDSKTSDNPHVTERYMQRIIENYPKWWVDKYLNSLWDNRAELIYEDFSIEKCVIDVIDPSKISKDAKRRNGLDWGWVNPSAILWGYIDYDGVLIIYDEFYQNKTPPELLAKQGLKHGKIITAADHSAKGIKMPTINDPERTIWGELQKYGLWLVECDKHELSNIVLVNGLFKKGKLKICKNCINTIREVKGWKWKQLKLGQDDRQMLEEPIDAKNHTCDALNYLCADLEELIVESPEQKAFKQTMQYAIIKKSKTNNDIMRFG